MVSFAVLTQLIEVEGKTLLLAAIELQGFLVSSRTKLQRLINFDGTLKEQPLDLPWNVAQLLAPDQGIPEEGVSEQEQASSEQGQIQAEMPERKKPSEQQSKEESEDMAQKNAESNEQAYKKHTGPLLAVAKLVDTTLFRAYMLARPTMAGPLFRLPNFCDANVVNEKLLETGRYYDLIDYLFGKKLHARALEMLQKFGEKIDDSVPEQLRGPRRTVTYLQNLSADMIDIILEYAEWPLRTDPELGMEIFQADSENAESLPRQKVLDFLNHLDSKLAMRYLEHVITELHDDTSDFHQHLATMYLEGLPISNSEVKTKALLFFKSSQHYQPWRILKAIPRDLAYLEARAIVLGKMKEHRQALSIYVFDLHDATKAER